MANVLLTLIGSGIAVHLVPILTGTGIDRGSALAIAATAGIAGMPASCAPAGCSTGSRAISCPSSVSHHRRWAYLLLNHGDSRTTLTVAVLIMGYCSGAGLQTTTYLTSRYAGLKSFGTILA